MKLYEKARKMKKAFCFDICPFLSQEKCVHVWFEFFPNYLSRIKEPRKHFSALALPEPQKMFPWFLFPTSAKPWEKLKMRRRQIYPPIKMDKYGNKTLLFSLFTFVYHITMPKNKESSVTHIVKMQTYNLKVMENLCCKIT